MTIEEALKKTKNDFAKKNFINGSTLYVNRNFECYLSTFHNRIAKRINFKPEMNLITGWNPCV